MCAEIIPGTAIRSCVITFFSWAFMPGFTVIRKMLPKPVVVRARAVVAAGDLRAVVLRADVLRAVVFRVAERPAAARPPAILRAPVVRPRVLVRFDAVRVDAR